MTREEAIDVLKRNYPSSCFEDLCKAVDIAIKALEKPEIIRCKECKRCVDLDERVTAQFYDEECEEWTMQTCTIEDVLDSVCDEYTVLQPAQPEPLSDAYTKAVWTWLLEYQIKAAELKGRYTPYEVLSWVANDWRKEHEGSD